MANRAPRRGGGRASDAGRWRRRSRVDDQVAGRVKYNTVLVRPKMLNSGCGMFPAFPRAVTIVGVAVTIVQRSDRLNDREGPLELVAAMPNLVPPRPTSQRENNRPEACVGGRPVWSGSRAPERRRPREAGGLLARDVGQPQAATVGGTFPVDSGSRRAALPLLAAACSPRLRAFR